MSRASGALRKTGTIRRAATSTHYEVLGVPWTADEEMIRTAFRKAAKSRHPDLNAGDPAAGQQFQEVVAAYELLKNPDLRQAYDEQLRIERRARRVRLVASLASGVVSGAMVAMAMWLWYAHYEVAQSARVMTAAVEQADGEQATTNDGGANNLDDGRKAVAAAIPPDQPLPGGQPSPQSGDSPTNDQSDAQAQRVAEWERLQMDGDPMATWDFAVRNPNTAESVLARSKVLMLIETTRDLFFLHLLHVSAPDAIAELARQRLVKLGALTAADNNKTAARDPPANADGSLEQRATSFVSAQISAWSSGNPRQLAALTKTFADEVFFNGTLKSRLAVMTEKRRLQGQFPDRVYEALPNSITTECVANACRVVGAIDWKTRGAARPSASRERMRFEYGVLFAQGAFSVISENTLEVKHDEQAEDTDPPRRLPVPRPTAAKGATKGKSEPPRASQIERAPGEVVRSPGEDLTQPY